MRLAHGILRGRGGKRLGQLRPIPILGGVIMTFARLDRMVTRQGNFAISIFDLQVSWLGVLGATRTVAMVTLWREWVGGK